MTTPNERVIACGAGFAGDRTEPAVALAASGFVDAVGLECLAERTLVPGLRALKFVIDDALPGGVYATLHAGLHWQKAAIWVLLDLDLD